LYCAQEQVPLEPCEAERRCHLGGVVATVAREQAGAKQARPVAWQRQWQVFAAQAEIFSAVVELAPAVMKLGLASSMNVMAAAAVPTALNCLNRRAKSRFEWDFEKRWIVK
jgi:hypothetical protein